MIHPAWLALVGSAATDRPVCPQAAAEVSGKARRPRAPGAAPGPVLPEPGLPVNASQPAHGSIPGTGLGLRGHISTSPVWSRELPPAQTL